MSWLKENVFKPLIVFTSSHRKPLAFIINDSDGSLRLVLSPKLITSYILSSPFVDEESEKEVTVDYKKYYTGPSFKLKVDKETFRLAVTEIAYLLSNTALTRVKTIVVSKPLRKEAVEGGEKEEPKYIVRIPKPPSPDELEGREEE